MNAQRMRNILAGCGGAMITAALAAADWRWGIGFLGALLLCLSLAGTIHAGRDSRN